PRVPAAVPGPPRREHLTLCSPPARRPQCQDCSESGTCSAYLRLPCPEQETLPTRSAPQSSPLASLPGNLLQSVLWPCCQVSTMTAPPQAQTAPSPTALYPLSAGFSPARSAIRLPPFVALSRPLPDYLFGLAQHTMPGH